MSPHIEIYDKKLGKNGRTLLFRQFRANLILTRLGSVESRIWGYLIFQMIGIIYKVTNDLNNTMHKYGICFSTLKKILKMFDVPIKNTNGKLKTV